MATRKHKDVEFAVGDKHYSSIAEAMVQAVTLSLMNGRKQTVDILVHSRSGARWFAGDEGVEIYDEDPDASVYERITIQADSQGRIP